MGVILYLNDVAMVAADTTRTMLYISELARNDILPSYVLLLLNNDKSLLPGQDSKGLKSQLFRILEEEGVQYEISPNNDINSNEVVSILSDRQESVFIFSGFGGVLLRDNILSIGKKFLHIHGGYLPDYKGSTTNYYSLINEDTMGASSIFLTKEIDCGPILFRKKFSAPSNRKEIDHFYDAKFRAGVLVETLKKYLKTRKWEFELRDNKGGETYYIIHPVLKHLSILRGEACHET